MALFAMAYGMKCNNNDTGGNIGRPRSRTSSSSSFFRMALPPPAPHFDGPFCR